MKKFISKKIISMFSLAVLCKMLYEMRKREKIVKCLGVRY